MEVEGQIIWYYGCDQYYININYHKITLLTIDKKGYFTNSSQINDYMPID